MLLTFRQLFILSIYGVNNFLKDMFAQVSFLVSDI